MNTDLIRVNSIEIFGFRGYIKKQNIKLAQANLLFGKTGTGKTSTIGAIEWCLFGDSAAVPATGRTRTREELLNTHSQAVEVTLNVQLGRESIIIKREKIRL